MPMRSLASLQEKDSGHTTDNGEEGRADAGSTGLRGDLSRRGVGGRRGGENLGGGNGRHDNGGRRSRDHDGGGVLELGGGDQSGGGGHSRSGSDDDGGVRRDGGLNGGGGGGALGRARGESDGLDTGVGGDDSGLAAGALTSLDVEGLGVLEDLGVALKLEDKAVDGVGAERGVDRPGVLLVGVGDTGYDELVMSAHTRMRNALEKTYWQCRRGGPGCPGRRRQSGR